MPSAKARKPGNRQRRIPKQGRSIGTVEHVLQAAEELFLKDGLALVIIAAKFLLIGITTVDGDLNRAVCAAQTSLAPGTASECERAFTLAPKKAAPPDSI
jgi:hypothetical protein